MTLGTKVTRRGALLAATGAAAACAQSIETPPYEGAIEFSHGVASGDPQHDRVVIWTRVTPERAGPAPVRWIVARNRELTDVVKTGVVGYERSARLYGEGGRNGLASRRAVFLRLSRWRGAERGGAAPRRCRVDA